MGEINGVLFLLRISRVSAAGGGEVDRGSTADAVCLDDREEIAHGAGG
jgi:hypothetical protein